MNWFEGGRRVTLLAQGSILIGIVWSLFLIDPYIEFTLATKGPSEKFFLSDSECGEDDKSEWKKYDDVRGIGDFYITFCFLSVDSSGFIPYQVDDKGVLIATEQKYDPELQEYIDERISNFSFSSAVGSQIKAQYDKQYWGRWFEEFRKNILAGFLVLCVVTAFSYILGWIVRGFAGIPGRADRKPTE